MDLISLDLNTACRQCGSYRFRMEAARRDDCPVVCARCGHCAGRWGTLRVNGVAKMSGDVSAMLTGMIGRTLGRRRRRR